MNNIWNTDLNNFYGFAPFNLLLAIGIIIIFIVALVYFYKNSKQYNKHSTPLYFVLLIIFTAAGFIYINKDQKITDLKADYGIAIGKIDKYIVTKGVNKLNTCDFTFEKNSEVFYGNNNSNPNINLPNEKPNLEINYLVIYQKLKPTNSYVLLNYPIKDSLDFKKYQVLFEKEIPENVFRND